jgi:alcohol dehydrogenase class IV
MLVMDPWTVYQYWSPGKLIFGPNSLNKLTDGIGSKDIPLIITDKGVSGAGILKKVTDVLDGAGIKYHIFEGITPTPSIEAVEEATSAYRDHSCTMVVGVGGGSSIDGAKAVSLRVTQEGSLREYSVGKPVKASIPPIYAIPTTAGTGSEVSALAVISDNYNQIKIVLREMQLIPKVAILDPVLLRSIPPRIAAETGADALAHGIEAYVSLNSNAVTDALALSAIKLIAHHLRKMVANPGDVKTAGQMLIASCIAGLSFSNAGLGLVHSLAPPVGAYLNVSHGLSCALYLPVVMDFNIPARPEKFVLIADAMGENIRELSFIPAAKQAVSAVRDLFTDIGLPKTFSEIGIEFRLNSKMVDYALASPSTKVNPRIADRNQIERLFEAPH